MLSVNPFGGDGGIDVGLVNDLWDEGRASFQEGGIGRGQFTAVDGVDGGVFKEKGEERRDAVEGEEE